MRRAAGFVLVDDSTPPMVLLLRNARHATWGFPKGHLEAGETELDGAYREVAEETGVRREQIDVLPAFRESFRYTVRAGSSAPGRPAADMLKELTLFVGRISAATAAAIELSDEHDSLAWVDFATARRQLAPFGDLCRILDAARVALGA